MTAAAPVRRMRCAGAAAVAALLLFGMSARAEVFCRWNGSEYICSGGGDTVTVIGGADGCQGDIIVTNVVGVCTNCVAMSPDYVRQFKADALHDIDVMKVGDDTSAGSTFGIQTAALDLISSLSAYTNTCEVSSYLGAYASGTPGFNYATNFLHGVGAYPGESPSNLAASLIQGLTFNGPNAANNQRSMLSCYDGAAAMYNQFSPYASSAIASVQKIYDDSLLLDVRLNALARKIDTELIEDECTAQWDGGGSGGGDSGGGSTIVTNQMSGNWCTYDQGEAIKQLLEDIKEWGRKQANYLNAISNRVSSIDYTIKTALFTSYTHIPTEEELQTSWQELYLTGSNPNFPAYASTNIVARIELLLAGISGVLTNVSDYASQDEFADESLDSTNFVENAMGDFTNQFVNVMQGRAASSRSVGDALVRLYQKFRTWSGTPFSTEYIINSYSVEFESGNSIDVPGFAAAAQTLPWANLIRVICRSAMSVIWILMTVAIFVRFQIAFFQWCFKYVKWAVEVLQGLFV